MPILIILTTNLFTRQMIDPTKYCKYYTPEELVQTIEQQNRQLSIFSINCRSINANWDSLNELIFNIRPASVFILTAYMPH